MQIEQPQPELSIRNQKGKLTIDQTQAWEETNLKSATRWTEIAAQEAEQAVQEGTARRARQGSELLEIHEDQNVIVDHALENGHFAVRKLSIAYIPSPLAVKISYHQGELDIQVKLNKAKIDFQTQHPEIAAQRGSVDVNMKQYANLEINVTT